MKLRLVVMEGPPANYPEKFRLAAKCLPYDVEVETYPHIRPANFSRPLLAKIRHLLNRRSDDELVLFCSGPLEHFVSGADLSFHFSAYRSWFDANRIAVVPHPWSPLDRFCDRAQLIWRSKPPLKVAFMGSTYANSRVAKLASKMPQLVRNWILKGELVRNVDRVAWLDEHNVPVRFLPTFARFETLEGLADAHDRQLEVVDTKGFDSSETRMRAFAQHLRATTYVLCPRGAENFSFRVYEALRFGRVPVIVDTDMVLPAMIDWQKVALVVPAGRPEEIWDRIVRDYEGMDPESFVARQKQAFATSDWLDSGDWLAGILDDVVKRLAPAKNPIPEPVESAAAVAMTN